MADMSIKSNDAQITVIGKSWPDGNIDSGGGEWLEDLGDIDPLDIGWEDLIVDPDTLPDAIEIIKPPAKTTYKEGERISLSGMTVVAKKDGATWTSDHYPNGVVPHRELFISQEDTGWMAYSDGDITIPYATKELIGETVIGDRIRQNIEVRIQANKETVKFVLINWPEYGSSSPLGLFMHIHTPGDNYLLRGQLTPIYYPEYDVERRGISSFGIKYEHINKTFGSVTYVDHFPPLPYASFWDRELNIGPPASDSFNFGQIFSSLFNITKMTMHGKFVDGETMNKLLYMDIEEKDCCQGNPFNKIAKLLFENEATNKFEKVVVKWPRPVDGQILQTSFDITVEEAPSGHTHHSGTF